MKYWNRRRAWRLTAAGLFLILSLGLAAWSALILLDDPLTGLRPTLSPSVRLLDRRGVLLREFLSSRDTRSEWLPLDRLGPHLVQAAVAAEDKRFFRHFGLDPVAVCRAALQNVRHRTIISGASTITMQLARLIDPGPRTWRKKLTETLAALRIERTHGKERIIEEYLNRVPCGNLIHGVPAAARFYFDKTPEHLSPSEAAFLMALPQAPSLMNPLQNPQRALARRNRILGRMADLGFLGDSEAERAQREPIRLADPKRRFQAPHFVQFVKSRLDVDPSRGLPGEVRTTLDLDLQTKIERLAAKSLEQVRAKGVTQAAVLVLDHRTMEILAWVGSSDFFDPVEGQNDGILALRQPGSTVKPFTYAAAFDQGFTPADLIDDTPVEFGLKQGVYTPTNYDDRFHGRVSARTALASSLNVPAVKVLQKTGVPLVHQRMKEAGLTSLNKEPDYYGLGLTLGAGEVSLLELATAYATLASGGLQRSPVWLTDKAPSPGKRVFSPQAAFLATDILSDDTARATGFGRDSLLHLPFPAAAKTGTSKNFRDNWTVGYTSSYLVAVWAGNFDARPMGRVSGITGAGPLWRQVMRLLAPYYPTEAFQKPAKIVQMDICPETGLRATPQCPNHKAEYFIEAHRPHGYCLLHQPLQAREFHPPPRRRGLAILHPRPGERYLLDPGIETEFQNLLFEARTAAGLETLVWYVNGMEAARISTDGGLKFYWPLQRGRQEIKLVGLAGGEEIASDRVVVDVY